MDVPIKLSQKLELRCSKLLCSKSMAAKLDQLKLLRGEDKDNNEREGWTRAFAGKLCERDGQGRGKMRQSQVDMRVESRLHSGAVATQRSGRHSANKAHRVEFVIAVRLCGDAQHGHERHGRKHTARCTVVEIHGCVGELAISLHEEVRGLGWEEVPRAAGVRACVRARTCGGW